MSKVEQNLALSVAEARDQFADIINRVAYGHERILLARHGKVLVAMIPVEDLEALEAYEDMLDQQAIDEAWHEFREKGGTPIDEMRQRLEARIDQERDADA